MTPSIHTPFIRCPRWPPTTRAFLRPLVPSGARLQIHYNGWPPRWDEWLSWDSPRIAPFRTRTQHLPHSQHVSPAPISAVRNAPITGTDDVRVVMPEVSRVLQEISPMVDAVRRPFFLPKPVFDLLVLLCFVLLKVLVLNFVPTCRWNACSVCRERYVYKCYNVFVSMRFVVSSQSIPPLFPDTLPLCAKRAYFIRCSCQPPTRETWSRTLPTARSASAPCRTLYPGLASVSKGRNMESKPSVPPRPRKQNRVSRPHTLPVRLRRFSTAWGAC